jgi:hypothetical protein
VQPLGLRTGRPARSRFLRNSSAWQSASSDLEGKSPPVRLCSPPFWLINRAGITAEGVGEEKTETFVRELCRPAQPEPTNWTPTYWTSADEFRADLAADPDVARGLAADMAETDPEGLAALIEALDEDASKALFCGEADVCQWLVGWFVGWRMDNDPEDQAEDVVWGILEQLEPEIADSLDDSLV